MDWAEMLERMYTRWAAAKGFKVETLDRSRGAPIIHPSSNFRPVSSILSLHARGEASQRK